MPGLTDWFDVFRCGTHTDRFGREVTITRDDIDAAIDSYKKDSAPIVVGHPSTNAPAFGWIGAFRRVGDVVQAKASSVADEFVDVVQRHLYKNRSLAFGPGPRFRHVGFLGAAAPAVKGLQDIQFANKEDYMDVEFSEAEPVPAETAPAAEADSTPPEPDAETAEPAKAEEAKDSETAALCEESFATEVAALKAEIVKANEALKDLREKHSKALRDLSAARHDLRQNEFAAYADELVAGGCLSKDKRPQLMEFMECLHGLDDYEFSEGSMPVLQRFQELFKAVAQHPVQMTEFASPETAAAIPATDSVELARLARAYIDSEAKAGRTVSPSAAVKHVMKG